MAKFDGARTYDISQNSQRNISEELSGGYVAKPAAKSYRFPISVIDLKTGLDRTVVLDVPFKGKISASTFGTIPVATKADGEGCEQ